MVGREYDMMQDQRKKNRNFKQLGWKMFLVDVEILGGLVWESIGNL